MNNHAKLPKNILRIEDLTFVLPDGFDGELSDALDLLSKYLLVELSYKGEDGKYYENENDDDTETLSDLLNHRHCAHLKYGIFTLNENGDYELK